MVRNVILHMIWIQAFDNFHEFKIMQDFINLHLL